MSLTKRLNNNWFKEDLVSVYCLATSSQKEAISRTVSGWHVWILLRILTVQKLWIASEIIHALRKKRAAGSKLKKSPTDHQQQNYRELRAKAKTLIRESREIREISRGSPYAFGPFLSSIIKRRPSLRRWARAMTIGRALEHQHLNRSPSCLTLTLCRLHCPLRGSHFVSTFHALTPHIKWAGDPGGNGFDISQRAWYKQSNWIRRNSSASAEGNRWPDRTVPDHVIQQILVARHFSGGQETREYCTYFQERKEKLCGELSISLLPVISKVLERCVLAGLRHHMSHLISREQHGFLAGRSCLTRLTSVLHYIGGQIDAGKQIDITNLDMSKGFDKVDHTKLLGRLHQYGITGKLHNWFRSYLQWRKQQVTVLGATSRELPVTSGVPQGSLLGPILILLFVDDLLNTVKTSRVVYYADGTKIFKSIDDIKDCNALQSDISDLVSWSESSAIISDQPKCKNQCITSKKSFAQPTYIINETHLESCDTEEDLGVWVSSNLNSDKQVTNSKRKPTNSSALCAELLGTSKAPKRVVHFMFLSSGAISATQPKYGRQSPLAYWSEKKTCSAVLQN